MTTSNTYVFLDSDNVVIDCFAFDDETSDDNTVNHIKELVGASDVIRYDNGVTPLNSTKTVKYLGVTNPGYVWDGVDTFIPPKPGDGYILNFNRTVWVPIPQNNNEPVDMR